jgi:threonine dehydrogenase-like Zn-dependent dehydrogenase
MATLKLEGSSGKAMRQSLAAVRRGGVVSVPGVYAGFVHAFLLGDAFDKGIKIALGQTHVQKYMPELLQFVEEGRLQPDVIISHRMKLAQAAEGYTIFDQKQDSCRKVVLTP